jgi:hypothetical protein
MRQTAARFESELIAFRRVLKKVLGAKHRDCRYLSLRRTRRDDAAATEPDPTPQTPEAPENAAPAASEGEAEGGAEVGLTGTDST